MSAHVITLAQQKGGVAKTTLAIHLAAAFAKQGYSTMLFDTDPQGTASHWHAQRKKSDIGLIATSGWRLTRDLAMAREANDIIIIDTPPHAEMDIKVATRAADLVLVPIQPSPADLWAVKETMNTVAGEASSSMVVLTRVVHRANITKDIKDKLSMLDIKVADTEIGNRVLFAASMETGMTVLDGFKNPSQLEIDSLVGEISQELGLKHSAPTKTSAKTSTSTSKKSSTKKTTAKKPVAKKATTKKTTKVVAKAKKTTTKKSSSKKSA